MSKKEFNILMAITLLITFSVSVIGYAKLPPRAYNVQGLSENYMLVLDRQLGANGKLEDAKGIYSFVPATGTLIDAKFSRCGGIYTEKTDSTLVLFSQVGTFELSTYGNKLTGKLPCLNRKAELRLNRTPASTLGSAI